MEEVTSNRIKTFLASILLYFVAIANIPLRTYFMQMKGGEIKTHNKEKSLLELLYDLNLFKKEFGIRQKQQFQANFQVIKRNYKSILECMTSCKMTTAANNTYALFDCSKMTYIVGC